MLLFALDVSAVTQEEKKIITKEFLKDGDSELEQELSSIILHHNMIPFGGYSQKSKEYIQSHLNQLGTLTWIEQLDLSGFNLDTFPDSLLSMKNLRKLNLSHNKINLLPNNIGQLDKLKELVLYYNNIHSLPESINNLENLERLALDKNKITNLPNNIERIDKLRELSLSNNNIQSLPDSINNLKNLARLYLNENKITNLPNNIEGLNKLEHLSLSNNLLTSVPESLKNLNSLEYFNLSNNNIEIIPAWLSEKKRLKEIYAQNTLIQHIPHKFKNWILSGGTIKISGQRFVKTGEGDNLGFNDIQFFEKKRKKQKPLQEKFNNRLQKSALYKKIEKQHPHIDLDNLSEIRPKDLPESNLDGKTIIALLDRLLLTLNFETDAKPLYIDFYETTEFLNEDSDPISNKKCFQQIGFPLIKGFLKTIWDMPLSKGEAYSLIGNNIKPLLKNVFTYILTKLNDARNDNLSFLFMRQLIQIAIQPLNTLEILHPTLAELQKREILLIEKIEEKLRQFIAYKKELCFDFTFLYVEDFYQIPIRSYYKISLDNDLGLYYQGIPAQMRMPMPMNDPFEGNPWSVFDSFLMRFTPNYLITSIVENTKKSNEENHLFTIEEIALFLKDNDAWNSSDSTYYEPYFTEDPSIVENQSTLTNKGAQKVLELLGVISEE